MKRSRIVAVLASTAVIAVGGATIASATSSGSEESETTATTGSPTEEERARPASDDGKPTDETSASQQRRAVNRAVQTALQRYPGTLHEVEREHAKQADQSLWEVTIRSDQGVSYEVLVDATSSKILDVEKENKHHDRNDDADDDHDD